MIQKLAIDPAKKGGKKIGPKVIAVFAVLFLLGGLVVFFITQKADRAPIKMNKGGSAAAAAEAAPSAPPPAPKPGEPVLTVSGYVVPHERIEISPKFQGTVEWIGVKKGDVVKKDEVLVKLEDAEYRARLQEAEGRLAMAKANLKNADVTLERLRQLNLSNAESKQALDNATYAREAAAAEVETAEGTRSLAKTYLDWCTIKAPIDGTILEKLVNPNELVVPQSFGGGRGPSTAFLAMADLNDLQIEIDLNEADIGKVHLNQKCRVSPEAYPDKSYSGFVAEIAPEANRSKGTLQVKVQVESPDAYLTPELTAKVDFLME